MSNNSVVLITGGLTGIGRAAAVSFAKKGAKVVVAGRRDEVGQALAKELRSLGSEAEFINADVRKDEDVRALVDKTVARFGRLDVAVNNAGTEGQVGPITDQTAESYAAISETPYRCAASMRSSSDGLSSGPMRARKSSRGINSPAANSSASFSIPFPSRRVTIFSSHSIPFGSFVR
jgi:NAD(P)-dependent dehydrogenase (short-subunit alcohol dehydrogenase family)